MGIVKAMIYPTVSLDDRIICQQCLDILQCNDRMLLVGRARNVTEHNVVDSLDPGDLIFHKAILIHQIFGMDPAVRLLFILFRQRLCVHAVHTRHGLIVIINYYVN